MTTPARDPRPWRLGTMGFSYADWGGVFYPRGVDGAARLREYATCFNAVELDTTFHAVPAEATVARWAEATPDDFAFSAKLPRAVTHAAAEGVSLVSEVSRSTLLEFLAAMRPLDAKLHVLLAQFPAAYEASASRLEDVGALLDWLPWRGKVAVEFRHDSWWHPRTKDVLGGRGAAWVVADEPPMDVAMLAPDDPAATAVYKARPPVKTTDWFYVRWLGRHEQFEDLATQRLDPTSRLKWWAGNLAGLVDSGKAQLVYGFFNNGYSGHSPAACRRFRDLAGLPNPEVPARQGTLF